MAGASTALRLPAIQSPSSLAHQQAADFLPQTSSISRLCVSSYKRPSLPRLRTHVPFFSGCFIKAPISFSGLHLSRTLGFSLAASPEDSASVSTKGTEANPPGEGLSKAASDLSKFAAPVGEGSSKAASDLSKVADPVGEGSNKAASDLSKFLDPVGEGSSKGASDSSKFADPVGEGSSKAASDLSKFLDPVGEGSSKAASDSSNFADPVGEGSIKAASDLSKFLDPVGEGSSKAASYSSKFADQVGGGSSKAASDLSKSAQEASKPDTPEAPGKGAQSGKDAVVGKDRVLKAEAAKKEDGSQPANKFIGVLRDTTEELREQAEKARAALAVTAQETAAALAATAQGTAEKSKENLSYIAENAPDPIREIADTALKAHSADTPKKFAKIHDFCLGIPYGSTLVIGGLLWFIISGSTAAIRFGVIFGGILLGLSISSLSAWKIGEPTKTHVIGQAVISAILAFRQVRRLFEVKAFFPAAFFTLISAGMFGFYCYVLLAGGNPPPKKTKHAPAA